MIEINEAIVQRFHGERGTPTRDAFDDYLDTLEGIRDGKFVDVGRPLHVVVLHALTDGHMSYSDAQRLLEGWLLKDPISFALFNKIRAELLIKEVGGGL